MRVNYQPRISIRIREAIQQAKREGRPIDCIELTKDEWDEFYCEHIDSLLASPHCPMTATEIGHRSLAEPIAPRGKECRFYGVRIVKAE